MTLNFLFSQSILSIATWYVNAHLPYYPLRHVLNFLRTTSKTPSTPPSQTMDPNLALSLLHDTPTPPTNNPPQNLPQNPPSIQTPTPNHHALTPRDKNAHTSAAMPIAQHNQPWISPPGWESSYRRGAPTPFVPRVEDLICPRCAPWGVVCTCSPPGSGNQKTFTMGQLCCVIL